MDKNGDTWHKVNGKRETFCYFLDFFSLQILNIKQDFKNKLKINDTTKIQTKNMINSKNHPDYFD